MVTYQLLVNDGAHGGTHRTTWLMRDSLALAEKGFVKRVR